MNHRRSGLTLWISIAGLVGCGGSGSSSGTGGQNGAGGQASGTGGTLVTIGTGGERGSGGTPATGTGGAATAGTGGAGATGTGGAAATGTGGATGTDGGSADGQTSAAMTFFVTSDTPTNGNPVNGDLGGLAAADMRCQKLATAVGAGAKTWHAYLSVEAADGGAAVNARDRIGRGPWVNSKGVTVAADVTALHERFGDPEVFIDEHGAKINGQWSGSPIPNQHDVLTGSNRDGTVMAGATCANWTSGTTGNAGVGHTDGLGPGGVPMSGTTDYRPWNAVHTSQCRDLTATGGAGKLYCFVVN